MNETINPMLTSEMEPAILPPRPPATETQTIIQLPNVNDPMIMHYGSESKYERFGNSCFKKTADDEIVIKHTIISVSYNPDDTYIRMDGMFGKCWLVSVVDNSHVHMTYSIRNWIDIVEYYRKTHGMKFFEIAQYNIQDHGTWKQVIYSDEAKEQIKQFIQTYPNTSSTVILDRLFPTMQKELKHNAAYEIQVVLGRAYCGR
uniref:Uncharacterized protein n=1 Tax=viral metagenome TaxID=1070528 RepID=A0A6C0HJ08_9ZZZZ